MEQRGVVEGAEAAAAAGRKGAFPRPAYGKPVEARVDVKTGKVQVNEDVLVRYSTCVGCYNSCGNSVKVERATGRMLGVGGNPFHPTCAFPPLPFEAPLEDAYRAASYADGAQGVGRATLCGRGLATLDVALQPTRICRPLKRAGKRGEGKWEPISWEQLVAEVTEGGRLFAHLGEEQWVEGFKEVHDTRTPIDPARPGLGPKSNQVIIWNTRADGRRALNTRFAQTFGTLNNFSHNNS